VYLLEEQSCQISPQSDLKRLGGALCFFEEVAPTKVEEEEEPDEWRYEISY